MRAATEPVVTVGEVMMVFNGPANEALGVASAVGATFAGAEANVAIGLARLGHAVRYLTVLGDDPFGHAIHGVLRREGVDVSGIRFSREHPTGVMFKDRRSPGEPEVFYYRSSSAFAHAGPETFDPELWRDARLVHMTGITPALSAGCLALTRHLLNDVQGRVIAVTFDPNYRRKLWDEDSFRRTVLELLPQVDLLMPGLEEGRILAGRREEGEILVEVIDRVRGGMMVLRMGEAGSVFCGPGGRAYGEQLALEQVVDPVGAGDGFVAGVISGYLDGARPDECLRRGHAVAARVCQTLGDWEGLPTRGELEVLLAGR
jgi:2-dehydro-3-deoxygluconokinase